MNFLRTLSKRLDWGVVAALALALPLIPPFLSAGLPVSSDAGIHFHRIVSEAVDIQAGYLWPRWTPYLHGGFGYAIHNFYAPGIHILGGLIFLVSHLDPAIILKLMQFVATLLYPLGAYYFCRTFTGRPGALIAAAAYVYAPFRFHELWIESNYSQFVAMALSPWLLWSIARAAAVPRPRRAALIAVIYGAMVVIHHPTAFLFSPIAGLYALALSIKLPKGQVKAGLRRSINPLAATLGGLALGIALSAVFWLPALLELKYTQINTIQTNDFSVTAHFIPAADLFSGTLPVDRSALNLPSFLKTGQPQIAAAVLGLLVLLPAVRASRSLKAHVVGGALVTAFCIFMITPASAGLWTHLPIANLVVYPWRLLGVIAVSVLPGAAALPTIVESLTPRPSPIEMGEGSQTRQNKSIWKVPRPSAGEGFRVRDSLTSLVIIAVFFVAAIPYLYAPITFVPSPPPVEASTLDYEATTGNVGLTSGEEYLPIWATVRPLSLAHEDYSGLAWFVPVIKNAANVPPGATITASPACATGVACYDVQTSKAFPLTFHQMYFPGWDAKVDDQPVQPQPVGSNGLMTVAVPAGEHHVTLWYGGTPIQAAGDWISLIALLATVVLFVITPRRVTGDESLTPSPSPIPMGEGSSTSRSESVTLAQGEGKTQADLEVPSPSAGEGFRVRDQRLGAFVAIFMVAFVVINQAVILPDTNWFRPKSNPETPPASHPVHALFGNTLELLGYDLDSASGAPGQMVNLRLYWRVTQPAQQSMSAAVHLTGINDQGDWGGSSSFDPGGFNTTAWPTDRYVVDTYQFPIAANAPPYVGELRVSVFHLEFTQINGQQPTVNQMTYLSDEAGQNSFVLTNFRVQGSAAADSSGLTAANVTYADSFGDAIKLLGYKRSTDSSGQTCIMLRWQSRHDNLPDYAVMLHVLDGQGQMIKAEDGPPANGLYPTSAWVNNQAIDDSHCFDVPTGANTLIVGLYPTSNPVPLRATDSSGVQLPNGGLAIALQP